MRKLFLSVYSLWNIIKNGHFFSKKKFVPVEKGKILRILGNGKSLNNNNLCREDNVDYLVVNRHVLSDNYLELRPSAYVLADPHFFSHPEGLNILREINNKTQWKLDLYIVFSKKNRSLIKEYITNINISVIEYNISQFDGFKSLKYLFWKYQLSMPVVQNVLVASIMIGILKCYQTIELYGVEHTWTKYLFVDENNVVYLENPHFFDKEKVEAKALKDIQHTEEYPFYLILKNYSRMFESYWEIKEFLKDSKMKVRIINKTKGSFIDAFEKE